MECNTTFTGIANARVDQQNFLQKLEKSSRNIEKVHVDTVNLHSKIDLGISLIYDQLELIPNYENMDDSFDLESIERTQTERIELVRSKMAEFSKLVANLTTISPIELSNELRLLGQRKVLLTFEIMIHKQTIYFNI